MIWPLDLLVGGPKFTGLFFAEHGRKRGRSSTCLIVNIFIRFGDVCRHISMWLEIAPNFACFGS